MKYIKKFSLLALATFLYLSLTYTKQENVLQVSSPQKELSSLIKVNYSEIDDTTNYGYHTEDIEKLLAVTPVGSEVYLEDRGGGEWYLKIEKTFSAKDAPTDDSLEVEQSLGEIDSSLYGEIITI